MIKKRTARRVNKRAAAFLKRHTVEWAFCVVVANATIIVLTIWLFPKTTLTLSVALLFSMFISSISDLAGVITDAGQDEKIEDLADDDDG